jgi:hypothetical protein
MENYLKKDAANAQAQSRKEMINYEIRKKNNDQMFRARREKIMNQGEGYSQYREQELKDFDRLEVHLALLERPNNEELPLITEQQVRNCKESVAFVSELIIGYHNSTFSRRFIDSDSHFMLFAILEHHFNNPNSPESKSATVQLLNTFAVCIQGNFILTKRRLHRSFEAAKRRKDSWIPGVPPERLPPQLPATLRVSGLHRQHRPARRPPRTAVPKQRDLEHPQTAAVRHGEADLRPKG